MTEIDKIGDYCGDIYGCVDGKCEKCYKCNPLFWWLKRRPIPRQDKADEALKLLIEFKNKFGINSINKTNAYLNGIKYNLINSQLETI